LSAEVREVTDRKTLVVAIYAAPADAPEGAPIEEEERARYSIWLASFGDDLPIPVDHAQALGGVGISEGEPFLYWHGKAPGARPFS
jgi:hypothetical protein